MSAIPRCPYCGSPVDDSVLDELRNNDSSSVDCIDCGNTFKVNTYVEDGRYDFEVEPL